MSTILVPTDFSSTAEKAGRYAIELAKNIKSDVQLCNAIFVPAESPLAAQVVWPLEDYSSLKRQSTAELKSLTKELLHDIQPPAAMETYSPEISYFSEAGTVTAVVKNIMKERSVSLVVMGMSGGNSLTHLILGSNSLDMVMKADFPVLLVPHTAVFKGLNKIAFATDMSKTDIESMHSLASLARLFNAELLIVHITDKESDERKYQEEVDSFLNDVTCKINYHKIYYRHLKNKSINKGLKWIADHGQIDMLAMVHREHNFVYNFFGYGHTQKIARHLTVPLLVFPGHQEAGRFFW